MAFLYVSFKWYKCTTQTLGKSDQAKLELKKKVMSKFQDGPWHGKPNIQLMFWAVAFSSSWVYRNTLALINELRWHSEWECQNSLILFPSLLCCFFFLLLLVLASPTKQPYASCHDIMWTSIASGFFFLINLLSAFDGERQFNQRLVVSFHPKTIVLIHYPPLTHHSLFKDN